MKRKLMMFNVMSVDEKFNNLFFMKEYICKVKIQTKLFLNIMFKKIITAVVLSIISFTTFAQGNIEGIELGKDHQLDKFVDLDGVLYQVMPVEDEASEIVCGVIYIPVDSDTKIPITLNNENCIAFEEKMKEQYEISFDSVMNYNKEATLKFAINDREGVEYEFNKEKMGDEYDTFFVVWYESIAEKSLQMIGK